MRYIRYGFLALLGLALLVLALANRAPVTLRLLPDDLAGFAGLDYSIELPLFLVILGGIAGGLLVGFVWEWLREHKHRAAAASAAAEAERLKSELGRVRAEVPQAREDDVLALLEPGGKAR